MGTKRGRKQLIEWRRREERLIHGQDPDSSQDKPGESTSHSADSPASERDVPPEREEPPERVAPPERAEPPISSSGPELLTGDPAIEREAPLDPFDGMSPNELQQWREAENRVLGSKAAAPVAAALSLATASQERYSYVSPRTRQ